MKRLYLTVEGQTEQAFAVSVLQPHLALHNVMVVKPRLTGLHGRRRGKFPSGGMLNTCVHALADIRRWLLEDKSSDARFSTMIDLYALPKDFPEYNNSMINSDPYEQVAALELAFSAAISDVRFIPYLQLHEFESIILSQPAAFANWFDDAETKVARLTEMCSSYSSPERINHRRDYHPKAVIQSVFDDYDSNVDGPAIAAEIGLNSIRVTCPHFNQWLTALERLNG